MNREQVRANRWVPQAPETVWRFHTDLSNLDNLLPPWLNLEILTMELPLAKGSQATLRLKLLGFLKLLDWQLRIETWDPQREFADEEVGGKFRSFLHRHSFHPAPKGGTVIEDRIDYDIHRGHLLRLPIKIALILKLWMTASKLASKP
jgi:ligand-binding SRPBCC domain-containing protein